MPTDPQLTCHVPTPRQVLDAGFFAIVGAVIGGLACDKHRILGTLAGAIIGGYGVAGIRTCYPRFLR